MRTRPSIVGCLGVLLAVGTAAGEEKTGAIQGIVRFTGVVPPAKQIPRGDGATIDHYDLVIDGKSKGLRWVIAALEDAPPQPKLEAAEPAVIDQKDMTFIPRVVAVQHGRPVRFDNSDGFNHSVTTASRLAENEMNVFVTAREPVTKAFAAEKAPIRIGCALHGTMTAWLYVAPHPWVAVTDEKGAFALKDVPPGKYTLWLKHPDTGVQERRQIEVRAGEKVEVAVEWKQSEPQRDPPKGEKK
jgi:plastocyanin